MVEEGGGIDEKGFDNEWEEDNLKGEGIVRRAFLWNGKSLRFFRRMWFWEIGGRENKDGNLVKREKWEEGADPSHSHRNDRSLETNTRCT